MGTAWRSAGTAFSIHPQTLSPRLRLRTDECRPGRAWSPSIQHTVRYTELAAAGELNTGAAREVGNTQNPSAERENSPSWARRIVESTRCGFWSGCSGKWSAGGETGSPFRLALCQDHCRVSVSIGVSARAAGCYAHHLVWHPEPRRAVYDLEGLLWNTPTRLSARKDHALEGACRCAGAFHAAFSERAAAGRHCCRAAF